MTTRRANTRRRGLSLAGIASISAGAFLAVSGFAAAPAGAASVEPILHEKTDANPGGNYSCSDLGYDFEYKIDAQPADGVYELDELGGDAPEGYETLTVTISNAGVVEGLFEFDFDASAAVDAVLVKQATTTAEYAYDPAVTSDDDLSPAPGDNQGGISHVSFCRNLVVTTTSEEVTTTEEETTTTEEVTTTTEEQVLPTTSETVLGEVITKKPAVQGETLPRTGAGTEVMAIVGLGLIVLGAGATIAANRRGATV